MGLCPHCNRGPQIRGRESVEVLAHGPVMIRVRAQHWVREAARTSLIRRQLRREVLQTTQKAYSLLLGRRAVQSRPQPRVHSESQPGPETCAASEIVSLRRRFAYQILDAQYLIRVLEMLLHAEILPFFFKEFTMS